MTTTPTPGTEDQDIRQTWRRLAYVAEALGVSTTRTSGCRSRTKTIDELLADLAGVLPEGVAAEDAAAALAMLTEWRPQPEYSYEVRNLRQVGDHWEWVPFQIYDNEAMAIEQRDGWAEQTGELYLVFKVTKTLSGKVLPPTA